VAYRVDLSGVDWGSFKYMVYDSPKHSGTYQERYDTLGTYDRYSRALTSDDCMLQ